MVNYMVCEVYVKSIKLFKKKSLAMDKLCVLFSSYECTPLLMVWRRVLQNVLASFSDWIPTSTM